MANLNLNLNVNVKQLAANNYSIELTGSDAQHLDPARVTSWLNDRLACASANHCFDKAQTAGQRVDCVTFLARRRIAGVEHVGTHAHVAKLTKSATGLHLEITRDALASLVPSLDQKHIEARIHTLATCAAANNCRTRSQTLADKWKCVATLGASRFA